MKRLSDEFAVLLEAVSAIEAGMARSLLEAADIPCLIAGPDFDVAELGHAAHDSLRGTNVYVPKAAFERAQALLADAWPSDPD